MITYIARRIMVLIPLLFGISVISFVLIQLPPGDYLTTLIQQLEQSGTTVDAAQAEQLRILYGLDKPLPEQYWIWMRKILLHRDFGTSYAYGRPVRALLAERVPLTMAVSLLTVVFIWSMAVPIGIYSATHQYTVFDYFWTFVGFIGLATPSFLLALLVLWFAFTQFGIAAVGLFSPEYAYASWSVAKLLDLLKRIWVPVAIIGLSGTAGMIRVMRGTLLDELRKQYVTTARAKGLSELKLLFKYPVRVAINPFVSTIGWMLPGIVSGELLVSMVLNIPTTGPLLFSALMSQDMFLAGSIVMILSTLTVIGTLISDILLVWLDPRIRYEEVQR